MSTRAAPTRSGPASACAVVIQMPRNAIAAAFISPSLGLYSSASEASRPADFFKGYCYARASDHGRCPGTPARALDHLGPGSEGKSVAESRDAAGDRSQSVDEEDARRLVHAGCEQSC